MSNTNEDVFRQWVLAGHYGIEIMYNMANMANTGKTLSIKDANNLYSYALKIATIDTLTKTALILPHDASTRTTNKHIGQAAAQAGVCLNLVHVFQLPELSFNSRENKHYLTEILNNVRASMLNKRRNYKTRHASCLHWYEAMLTIIEYNACLTAHNIATIPTDPEGAIHILEHDGGTNFLGQLALEGDLHHIHDLEEQLAESSNR